MIAPPPITDEMLVIWPLLAALGGGVIGCILTLIRRGPRDPLNHRITKSLNH